MVPEHIVYSTSVYNILGLQCQAQVELPKKIFFVLSVFITQITLRKKKKNSVVGLCCRSSRRQGVYIK